MASKDNKEMQSSAELQHSPQTDDETVQSIINRFPSESEENPRLVKTMAQICLDYRREDATLATERLANYLNWRKKAYGSLKDINLREETKLQQQLQTGFLQLCPTRLAGGVGLVCLTLRLHDPTIYSAIDTMKCMHFFTITAIMEDPALAANGFVFVNNTAGGGRHNLDLSLPSTLASSILRSVPFRMNKIVLLNPPWLVWFFIPIFKAVLPAKLVARLHIGPPVEKLAELVGAIDQSSLPTSLGGEVDFDTQQHLDKLLEQNWAI